MKVYIAGKITGDPYYRAKFAQAERALTAAGHIVLNPAVLPEGMGKADYMRICLAMLDSADAIGLLHGWGNSPGARIEHDLARYNGKQVIYTWQLTGYKA